MTEISHRVPHIGDFLWRTSSVPGPGQRRAGGRGRWRRTPAGRGSPPGARRGWTGSQPPWRGPGSSGLEFLIKLDFNFPSHSHSHTQSCSHYKNNIKTWLKKLVKKLIIFILESSLIFKLPRGTLSTPGKMRVRTLPSHKSHHLGTGGPRGGTERKHFPWNTGLCPTPLGTGETPHLHILRSKNW